MSGGAAEPDSQFDAGLQSERTALAWQRAALSVAVGSLVLMRLAAEWIGVPGLLAGLAGLVAAAVILVRSHGRHARLSHARQSHASGPSLRMPGAALLVALTVIALVFGGAALVFVLLASGTSTGTGSFSR